MKIIKSLIVNVLALAIGLTVGMGALGFDDKTPEAPAIDEMKIHPIIRLEPYPTPEPTETPAEDLNPCPLTEEDYRTLAELMVCEAEIVMSQGVKFGVSPKARSAAVAWTAFNRFDAGYADTLIGVIKAKSQFAWKEGVEAPEWALELARDVGQRWWAEKCGEEEVGRTLPEGYFWFWGDGWENYFRNKYEGGARWDWSLPDPYINEED